MKILQISKSERPRERFRRGEILSNAEVLSLILNTGSQNESAIDLSHRLISMDLNNLSLDELMKIKGIGLAKASRILACFELNKRINSGKISEKVIKNPSDIASYYISKLKDEKREHFIAVFLDSKNKIIKDYTVSIGTLNSL